MKFQVFGCPSCQQPFQVAETQSGQVVQCPACAQTVEIPASTFVEVSPPLAESRVHDCPSCGGQFGVTVDMNGQHVGCPHCHANVLIQSPNSPQELEAPVIITDLAQSKKKKKKDQRWKSPAKPSGIKGGGASGVGKPKGGSVGPVPKAGGTEGLKPASDNSGDPTKQKQTGGQNIADDLLPPPQKPVKTSSKEGSVDRDPPSKTDAVRPRTDRNTKTPASATRTGIGDETCVDVEFGEDQDHEPGVVVDSEASYPDEGEQPISIDHLLPPRFDVLDPLRMRPRNSGNDQYKVFLPDGDGGTKLVDQRLVRVEHEGSQVSLRAMTEKEKQRRRWIQNLIAIVIGIIIMAIAFWLLL